MLKLILFFNKSSSKKFIKLFNFDLSSVTIKIFWLFKYSVIQKSTKLFTLFMSAELKFLAINKALENKFILLFLSLLFK